MGLTDLLLSLFASFPEYLITENLLSKPASRPFSTSRISFVSKMKSATAMVHYFALFPEEAPDSICYATKKYSEQHT